jgi:hypothetical protein
MRAPICLAIVLASFLPANAATPWPASPSALCEAAILGAEHSGEMPKGMLAAIGLVESGRPDPRSGVVRPWPWTIDANGTGQFFDTKAEAIAAVRLLQSQGLRSIDVGCMQINLMQHPDAFTSLDQAFDPASNAAYAVHFLKVLYSQTGDWTRSVAAYHSATPQIAADYQQRVLALWRPIPAPSARPDSPFVLNSLLYGKIGPAGRVYGLIMPSAPSADETHASDPH